MTSPADLIADGPMIDGLQASRPTEAYLTETLPGAGWDAISFTVYQVTELSSIYDYDLESIHHVRSVSRNPFEAAINNIKLNQRRIEAYDGVHQVRSVDNLDRDGSLGVLFNFQGTSPLLEDPGNVPVFEQLGVKVMQLTYQAQNSAGAGCAERDDGGLTQFGHEVIDAMERYGVVLDLSHCGERTSLDALDAVDQPSIISHANPKAVHDAYRNVTDEQIKAVAETGGVVGVTVFPPWVGEDPTMADVVEHFEHLADLVGPEHVSFGSDFTDNVDAEEVIPILADADSFHIPQDADEMISSQGFPPYPSGIETGADLPNLVEALLERFSAEEVRGFLGGNFRRVCSEVWDD